MTAATFRPGSWQLLFNNRLALAGLIILAVLVLLALLAPVLPLADPNETSLAQRLLPVFSPGHLLGTDHLGRDLLARALWGTQVSIAVGLSATLVAAVVGSLIGLLAGYAGGRTDNALMRGIDTLMAFPYILLALAIVAVLGPGLMNALYAIAIVNIPFFARNIRGVTLGIARREFVDAARLSGKSNAGILFTEILPNVLPTIVITISTTVGWMILETAGLSFLGLGAQPPQADLGSMLGEGRKLLLTAPHVSIIPGLMIFLLVMSINLLGDGIRDVLDPRLRSGSLARPGASTQVELTGDTSANDGNKAVAQPADSQTVTTLAADNLQTEFHLGKDIYKAVGGVDLDLRAGECLGLVGESGSGKSVTAMSLMRLVPSPPGKITAGRVQLHQENVLAASDLRLQQLRGARVAYVFQDPLSTLHPLFTVGEQISEAIRVHQSVSHRQAFEKAVQLLKRVQIPNAAERAKSYPHQLSGGMRQRVGIAMALANDAEVLVADEPTTALDVTVQAQVLKLLRMLQQESGVALLFITHDFGVVSEVCDRVAVMYAGRIVEQGETTDVLNAPAHPYTRKLIDCVPVPGQGKTKLESIPGLPPAVNQLPAGCHFAARCPWREQACEAQEVDLQQRGNRLVRCIKPLGKREQVSTL